MLLYKTLIAAGASLPFLIAAAYASPEGSASDAPGANVDEGSSAPSEASGSSEADASSDEKAAEEEKVADRDNKVICKHIARTGTRFGEKICATRKEWEQMRRDSQESVSDAQRRAGEYRAPN